MSRIWRPGPPLPPAVGGAPPRSALSSFLSGDWSPENPTDVPSAAIRASIMR